MTFELNPTSKTANTYHFSRRTHLLAKFVVVPSPWRNCENPRNGTEGTIIKYDGVERSQTLSFFLVLTCIVQTSGYSTILCKIHVITELQLCGGDTLRYNRTCTYLCRLPPYITEPRRPTLPGVSFGRGGNYPQERR